MDADRHHLTPCTLPRLDYTGHRGVENLTSGHRTRKTCGIFVCAPCLDSVYGVEGTEIPEYRPPFLCGFEPPRRPLPGSASNFENHKERLHGQ